MQIGFNLVIEVLVVSSQVKSATPQIIRDGFNLVIEVLVVSRVMNRKGYRYRLAFQSRNRGSCRFKCRLAPRVRVGYLDCFNLVIEVLVVSSKGCEREYAWLGKFQSRNRGTCRFKS